MAGTYRYTDADMTAPSGLSPALSPDLPEGLRAEFFEAVRQVIAASGINAAGAAIGGDVRPASEPVRFFAMRGSRHPGSELGAATQDDTGGPVRMEAAFMGLTGPMGVMPDHYTELVVARDRARDEAFGAFVDLFNHRAISLFYRAWAKYRLPVRFGETGGTLADPVSRLLTALSGLSGPGEDPRILGAAGLLARRVRSPDALRRTLVSLYDMPIEVIELQPRRIRIKLDEQSRLCGRTMASGGYARLATDAVLGATTIDVSGRFRVRIGPVDRTKFDAFFDGSDLRARMIATIRQVAGATADFDIQLVLRRDAVPKTQMGMTTRLGQSSWLLHGEAAGDRADAILRGV